MASSSSRNDKDKANWTVERHKTFFELCVKEVDKGNRPTTSFNKRGWKNIIDGFAAKENVMYDQKQLKNHFAITKDAWKSWHKLTNHTRVTIDPITGGVLCDDQTWNIFVEVTSN